MASQQLVHEITEGETIDGFHVNECVYESHVSKLYRVTHANYNLPLIMKVPKISVILPVSVFSGFETEMHILSSLSGKFTPKVYGKGDLAKAPYLVTEFIEGQLLRLATKTAPIEIKSIRGLIVPVCKAVHDLHRRNIIHLDLKPGNICNRSNGQAVLLDLGTAHHSHLPDMYAISHEHQPVTMDYVAPEQLFDIRTDSRSDIYAIGVILYELATGRKPYPNTTFLSVKKRLYVPPVPPSLHNPLIPEWLQEIILKCMEVNPNDRFSTAKEVAYALAHPNMVILTDRSNLNRKPGIIQICKNFIGNRKFKFTGISQIQPVHRLTIAPHTLVAVKLEHCSEDLKNVLCNTMIKMSKGEKGSYFTCLSVLKKTDPNKDDFEEFMQSSIPRHIQAQAELRHWLQPVELKRGRLNIQVVYGDPAKEIINYAKLYAIDHIVLCAHRSIGAKKSVGSVPSKVIAEALCTVTILRTPVEISED